MGACCGLNSGRGGWSLLVALNLTGLVSPYANSGDAGLRYINSDVTLHLHRLPVGEWIGLETTDHQATRGVAYGAARLYDEEGLIGATSCVAVAQTLRSVTPQPEPPSAEAERVAS